jgi:hypothetical protein
MHSERIPRSLLRGYRANTDIIKKSLHLGDSLQLAAGSFNILDSGLVVIPDPDPGRNDQKHYFPTSNELIH